MIENIRFSVDKAKVSWKGYCCKNAYGSLEFQAAPQNENNDGWLEVIGEEGYTNSKGNYSGRHTMVNLGHDDCVKLRDFLNAMDW